jgi:transcriptional regulator with XRE-family HTH domain
MTASSLTLVAARERLGLSRAKVATKLGVSEKTIYRWERGLTPVRLYQLRALAELYEVDVEDLDVPQEAAA